jgi:hypothetical integral membrane protein (TIGR02206 family)
VNPGAEGFRVETFAPFSALHAVTIAAIAIGIAALVLAARRGSGAARALATGLGVFYVVAWIGVHGWRNLPPQFDPMRTLPLQMCHLAALAGGLYLAAGWTWLRPVLYFWGLALTTQACITPTLTEGPSRPEFWFFWLTHGIIVAAAVYAIAIDGFRPTWRDYGVACVAGAIYVAVAVAVNVALGANYGFLGNMRPELPTIVDFLGPWPERIAAIMALVAAVMALLMLPWTLARRVSAK